MWPGAAPAVEVPEAAPEAAEVKRGLAAFGYGYLEEDFAAVLRAFQRHFRPAAVTGAVDVETAGRLAALADLVDAGPRET